MASPRVMASSSSANSDLTRQSSIYSLTIAELQSSVSGDPTKNLGSMSMDDLLRFCGENAPAAASPYGGGESEGGGETSISRQGSFTLPKGIGTKTVEEIWRDISAGGGVDDGDGSGFKEAGEMTLEDFLAKAGAVTEEDVRVPADEGIFGADSVMNDRFSQKQQQFPVEDPFLGFGNGVEGVGGGGGEGEGGGGRGGRGRKRSLIDPADRAALQRQKRMIKNRESAARSRERKQAYTVELESLVMQLEEENAQLLRHEVEQNKKRLEQLMEILIPVTDQRKPPRLLRRTRSMEW